MRLGNGSPHSTGSARSAADGGGTVKPSVARAVLAEMASPISNAATRAAALRHFLGRLRAVPSGVSLVEILGQRFKQLDSLGAQFAQARDDPWPH